MKLAVDEAVWGVPALFTPLGEVSTFAGRSVTPAQVAGADALIVRSVTRVDERLLAGSRVRFVGTASSGADHVDTAYLAARGVAFADAAGCNSRTVAEYVLAALLLLAQRGGFELAGKTLGVVGVGRIGSMVAEWGRALGMRVLLCDPPREKAHAEALRRRDKVEPPSAAFDQKNGDQPPPAARGEQPPSAAHGEQPPPAACGVQPPPAAHGDQPPPAARGDQPPSAARGVRPPSAAFGPFVSLDEIAAESDAISLHVPLTREGPDATMGMVDGVWLARVRRGAIFINTSRGEVVDESALLAAAAAGRIGPLVLDVWCGEPAIDSRLVRAAAIATPHVAGYSHEARRRAALMIRERLARNWKLETRDKKEEAAVPALTTKAGGSLTEIVLAATGFLEADRALREWIERRVDRKKAAEGGRSTLSAAEGERSTSSEAGGFDELRNRCAARREFDAYSIRRDSADERTRNLLRGWGFHRT